MPKHTSSVTKKLDKIFSLKDLIEFYILGISFFFYCHFEERIRPFHCVRAESHPVETPPPKCENYLAIFCDTLANEKDHISIETPQFSLDFR